MIYDLNMNISFVLFHLALLVLVFPPFLSKYRFLAHKVIDEYFFPQLCSFSISQESQRRIVVGSTVVITRCCLPYKCVHEKSAKISKVFEKPVDCICLARLKSLSFSIPIEDSQMPSSSTKFVENKSAKKNSKPPERRQNENRPALSDRQKRPDMQIYVPRALRGTQNPCLPIENKVESEFDKSSIDDNDQAISDERTLCCEKEVDEHDQVSKLVNNVENSSQTKIPHNETVAECTFLENKEVSNTITCLLTDKQNTFNEESETPSCSQTFEINILHSNNSNKKNKAFPQMVTENTNILPISKESAIFVHDSDTEITDSSIASEDMCALSDENLLKRSPSPRAIASETLPVSKSTECPYQEKEDSWESKFDDDGECLNPEVFKDLKSITGQIEVLAVKNKYTDYLPASEHNEGYDSIVELYDFPREFNTQDLVSAFSQFQQSSYSIKWVDDCHALAIFSSPCIANQALMLNNPFVKTRPISDGIKESKEKAKWCARHSEPVKPRPTTSAVLARRLVSGALGLRVQATKEQRDQERNVLKEAKEKRRLKAKQKQAIWDGIVL